MHRVTLLDKDGVLHTLLVHHLSHSKSRIFAWKIKEWLPDDWVLGNVMETPEELHFQELRRYRSYSATQILDMLAWMSLLPRLRALGVMVEFQ